MSSASYPTVKQGHIVPVVYQRNFAIDAAFFSSFRAARWLGAATAAATCGPRSPRPDAAFPPGAGLSPIQRRPRMTIDKSAT